MSGNAHPAIGLDGYAHHPDLCPFRPTDPMMGQPNREAFSKINAVGLGRNYFIAPVPQLGKPQMLDNVVRYLNANNIGNNQTFTLKVSTHPNEGTSTSIVYHYNPSFDVAPEDIVNGLDKERAIGALPTDLPATRGYRSIFLNQCNSFRYFIEGFRSGVVISTWQNVGSDLLTRDYVVGLVKDKGWAEIKKVMEKDEPAKDNNRP